MTEQTELQLPPHGCKWVNCIDGTTERMRLTAKNLLVIEAFNGAHWTLVTYSLDIILPRIYMLWRDEVERLSKWFNLWRDTCHKHSHWKYKIAFRKQGKSYSKLQDAYTNLSAVEAAWAALREES